MEPYCRSSRILKNKTLSVFEAKFWLTSVLYLTICKTRKITGKQGIEHSKRENNGNTHGFVNLKNLS